MPFKTTQKLQKFRECYYILVPKGVRDFFDLGKGDLVEVGWYKKIKKRR